MVSTAEDLEALLNRLGRHFEAAADGTYLVSLGIGLPTAALRLAPPVLVVRVLIGPAPQGAGQAEVFRTLLEHNASSLLHVAYGLEKKRIVLGSALELESLDLNELEAVMADMEMALAEHVPTLRKLVQKDG